MAGQDIKKRLAPGQPQQVNVGGDYIFLKFADRPVDIVITGGRSGGTRVTMEAGDKYRPGRFDAFEVQNTDPDNPAQVTLTVGEGDYNRQIVQGEIVVDPRVKTSDGRFVSDSRADHQVLVTLDYKREPGISAGDVETLDTIATDSNHFLKAAAKDESTGNMYAATSTNNATRIYQIDPEQKTIKQREIAAVTAQGATWFGGALYLFDANADYKVMAYGADGDGTPTEITGSLGESVQSLAVLTDGTIYAERSSDRAIVKWTGSAWEAIGVTLTATEQIGNTEGKATIYDISGTGRVRVFSDEFQTVELDYEGDPCRAAPIFNGSTQYMRVDQAGGAGSDLNLQTIETVDYDPGEIHYGSATEACSRLPGLVNRALTNDIRTDAALSIEWENGKAYATGEVLKAILDLLGIDTSGEYLDGITAFKADAKNRTYNINLGGRTFAADKITDDFAGVELPQVVTITALESLWSNN